MWCAGLAALFVATVAGVLTEKPPGAAMLTFASPLALLGAVLCGWLLVLVGWRLARNEERVLEAVLTELFGPPVATEPRGAEPLRPPA